MPPQFYCGKVGHKYRDCRKCLREQQPQWNRTNQANDIVTSDLTFSLETSENTMTSTLADYQAQLAAVREKLRELHCQKAWTNQVFCITGLDKAMSGKP